MSQLIKTPEVILLRQRIVKFSKDIKISTQTLEGTISIKNIRFYNNFFKELEVDFKGKIHVTYNRKKDWYDYSLLTQPNISKIKVKRIIRKNLEKELDKRLKYFGKELNYWDKIKKLNWI